jgi:hypothetical protein
VDHILARMSHRPFGPLDARTCQDMLKEIGMGGLCEDHPRQVLASCRTAQESGGFMKIPAHHLFDWTRALRFCVGPQPRVVEAFDSFSQRSFVSCAVGIGVYMIDTTALCSAGRGIGSICQEKI